VKKATAMRRVQERILRACLAQVSPL